MTYDRKTKGKEFVRTASEFIELPGVLPLVIALNMEISCAAGESVQKDASQCMQTVCLQISFPRSPASSDPMVLQ